MKNKIAYDILEDFQAICEKYEKSTADYEVAYMFIQLCVKKLMDVAPRHSIAIQTIKTATEEGIKWHVEERAFYDKTLKYEKGNINTTNTTAKGK